MSGGSYNYLCYKDADELFNEIETLEAMTTRLTELDHIDAAKETFQAIQIIRQAVVRVGVIKERLNGVWRAVEWYDSADVGIDSVRKSVGEYRGESHD